MPSLRSDSNLSSIPSTSNHEKKCKKVKTSIKMQGVSGENSVEPDYDSISEEGKALVAYLTFHFENLLEVVKQEIMLKAERP